MAEIDRLDADIAKEAQDSDLMRRLSGIEPPEDYALGLKDAEEALDLALRTKTSAQVRLPRKALSSGPLGLVTSYDQTPVEATPGNAAVSLRDLFRVEQVTTPTVRYYVVGRVSGVDVVAEGAIKPELTTEVTPEDGALVKLAGRFKTSMEFDSDAAAMRRSILRQAGLDLTRRENQLVTETMSGASGVLVKTGLAAAALDLIADAVGEQEALHGMAPTFLVASPTDLTAIRKMRSSGSGEYLVDPFSASSAGPFGLGVLSVPGLAPGTLWVGHTFAGVFYEHRQGATVRVGVSQDDFDRNLTTTIVEERVLPVITQPNLLTKITLS